MQRVVMAAVAVVICACGSMSAVDAGSNAGGAAGGGASGGGASGGGASGGSARDAGTIPVGATCSIVAQECQPGLACLPTALNASTTTGRCFAGGCDVVRQDCPAGTACGYPAVDGGSRVRGCYALRGDGGALAGQGGECSTLLDCDKGLFCIASPSSSTGFACERFCYSNRECDGGSSCALGAAYPGSQEATMYCQPPPVRCDLLTQQPCPGTQACVAIDGVGACSTVRNIARDAGCQYASDCSRGDICAVECKQVCNLDGGAPTCGSSACAPFSGSLQGVVGYCP